MTVERLTEGSLRAPTKYLLYQSIEVGLGCPLSKKVGMRSLPPTRWSISSRAALWTSGCKVQARKNEQKMELLIKVEIVITSENREVETMLYFQLHDCCTRQTKSGRWQKGLVFNAVKPVVRILFQQLQRTCRSILLQSAPSANSSIIEILMQSATVLLPFSSVSVEYRVKSPPQSDLYFQWQFFM